MMQSDWNTVVIVLCILLAAFLLWQELSRTNKKWLMWRLLAVLVVAAMLACSALPVSYQKFSGANQADEFILLTKGFNADSLKNSTNQKVFAVDESMKKAYPTAVLLNGLDELTDTLKGSPLHIYGDGLSGSQLAQLDSAAVAFHPATAAAGVTHIKWKSKLKTGEELRVQGSYHNPSAKKIKLLLKGLNTVLDTISVKPDSRAGFQLATMPKTIGRIIYTLQAVSDGDTTTIGSIPVQIEAVKPLRVLMLSASPGFETRFLKNWLSQQGYAVATRSAISKGKFSSEFINTPQFGLDRLSASTLNKFDVVIGDLSTLNGLSSAEGFALKQEVENSGLGVIVQADSTGKTSWLQKDFLLEKSVVKEMLSAIIINGKHSGSAHLNNGTNYIRYQNGTQPMVTNPQNRTLVSSTIAGTGKVVFSTLGNTHSWVLGGNQQDYAALWSALISKAARKDSTLQNNFSISFLPVAGEPAELQIAGASAITINGEQVAARQNPAISFERGATYWPERSGWQSIAQNGKTEWWYAYNKTEWESVQAAEKMAATTKHARENQPRHIVTKQIQQKLQIEVPKIYFYILLLAALTFLWIEKKLS
nr:hypothetical protein [uncultured Mucilaginibacter sp.]